MSRANLRTGEDQVWTSTAVDDPTDKDDSAPVSDLRDKDKDKDFMQYNTDSRPVSVSSLQSFETIRQTPGSAAASIAASNDHRWSDVIPPDSGLAFAVLWDPERNDLLTFSSPELSDARDAHQADSPSDAYDNRSQVLTIDPSVIPPSEYTSTSQFFRHNDDYRFTDSGVFPGRSVRGRTQTSSTLDGLDVYLRGSMLGKAHNANRHASCFQDFDDDFAFDPRTSFAQAWLKYMEDGVPSDVDDEGFFEVGTEEGEHGEEINLSSAFSVTTTSTSDYIHVQNEMSDAASNDWSALEAPDTPGYSAPAFTAPPGPHRRLHNHWPSASRHAASPSAVLARPEYNHAAIATPRPPAPRAQTMPVPPRPRAQTTAVHPPRPRYLSATSVRSFARGLGKSKKAAEPPGWVWVDVRDRDELVGTESPSSPSAASPM
ncbi:hypothetical protein C8R46DRAFT_1233655 [Mycena filopes]|nr:hypothetical protein C8R46DRAFT_1233655 [Mycena filopes]